MKKLSFVSYFCAALTLWSGKVHSSRLRDFNSDAGRARRLDFSEQVKNGIYNKVGALLGEIHDTYISSDESLESILANCSVADACWTHGDDGLLIKVVGTKADSKLLKPSLEKIGFNTTACFKHICDGFMPIGSLLALNTIETVKFASLELGRPLVGSAESEAPKALSADLVRERYGLDGTGQTIGVLSDGFDWLGGLADDVASGDLPPDVNILRDYDGPNTDEGRAISQLVHDIAPGAKIAFHTANLGQALFAQGILDLANEAGADVIVDDWYYYNEPIFQDGIIAQAVDEVVSQGVAYFVSAGNHGRNSWEGSFVDTGLRNPEGQRVHDFGGGDSRQLITDYDSDRTIHFVLNWDEPYFSATGTIGSSSDLIVNMYRPGEQNPFVSIDDNNIGRDPYEYVSFSSEDAGPSFEIEIVLQSGSPPSLMKWIIYLNEQVTVEHGTSSSTNFGHANSAGSAAVGVCLYWNTPGYGVSPAIARGYSSAGGTSILFDDDGNRLPNPEVRLQPRLMGPDGITNTFFGYVRDDGSGLWNFFGTSASAPNVAAVALLVLEAKPDLTPQELYAVLEQTAEEMDDEPAAFEDGFDFKTGYGFVNALGAVASVIQTAPPTLSPTAQPTFGTAPPSLSPTAQPTFGTAPPTLSPTTPPTSDPTSLTANPTLTMPSNAPSEAPSRPSSHPSSIPSAGPSVIETRSPNSLPSVSPVGTGAPTQDTLAPSRSPGEGNPTNAPSEFVSITTEPSLAPSGGPSAPVAEPSATPRPPSETPSTQAPILLTPPASTPAPSPDESEPSGSGNLQVTITTDDFGAEDTSFTVTDDEGGTILSHNDFKNNEERSFVADVESSKCYTLTVNDAFGDGLCCAHGNGGFSVTLDGTEVVSGGDFLAQVQLLFGQCDQQPPTTAEPTAEGNLQVIITTDNFGEEDTSFTVTDEDEETIISYGAFKNNEERAFVENVDVTKCFVLTVNDSFGDGLCCAHGNGGFRVILAGTEVGSGGEFGKQTQLRFGECGSLASSPVNFFFNE